ncbi:MAG: hypothetical protein ABI047_03220 [Jatrophihabitantaceae bacterium]
MRIRITSVASVSDGRGNRYTQGDTPKVEADLARDWCALGFAEPYATGQLAAAEQVAAKELAAEELQAAELAAAEQVAAEEVAAEELAAAAQVALDEMPAKELAAAQQGGGDTMSDQQPNDDDRKAAEAAKRPATKTRTRRKAVKSAPHTADAKGQ